MQQPRGFTLIELAMGRSCGFTLIEPTIERSRGFTLIELVVVILLLGVMVTFSSQFRQQHPVVCRCKRPGTADERCAFRR